GHQHPQEGGTRVGAPGHAHVPDGRERVVGRITHPSPTSLLKRKASRARSTRPLPSRPPDVFPRLFHARDRSTDRGSDAWSRIRRTAGSALSPRARALPASRDRGGVRRSLRPARRDLLEARSRLRTRGLRSRTRRWRPSPNRTPVPPAMRATSLPTETAR